MMVLDSTSNTLIVKDLRIAKNFFERFKGLIGSKPLKEGEGFLIPHCQGVHMIGMSYAIDAFYLDGEGKILRILERLQPFSLGEVDMRAKSVLELPAGTARRTHAKTGDVLFFYGDEDGGHDTHVPGSFKAVEKDTRETKSIPLGCLGLV